MKSLICALIIFGVFKLFSLGNNYEGLVITCLALIYWKIDSLNLKQPNNQQIKNSEFSTGIKASGHQPSMGDSCHGTADIKGISMFKDLGGCSSPFDSESSHFHGGKS